MRGPIRFVAMLMLVTGVLNGCAKVRSTGEPVAPPPPPPAPPPSPPPPPPASYRPFPDGWTDSVRRDGYSVMTVHYATNRPRAILCDAVSRMGQLCYGGGLIGRTLRYGVARVTIPDVHKFGDVSAPSRLAFHADPRRTMTIQAITALDAPGWAASIGERVARSRRKAALLFVHGYNVTFDEALYRSAQIAYDTRFPGPMVLFSWPSAGRLTGYPLDGMSVRFSTRQLSMTIRQLVRAGGAQDVYVVGHSMGTRVLTAALIDLGTIDRAARAKIREVVLAAPDIDTERFRTGIAPKLSGVGRITIYASSSDRALMTSSTAHLAQRLGDTRRRVYAIPPVETIDATRAIAAPGERGDMLGHSYFATTRTVMGDMRKLIDTSAGATARGLKEVRTTNGRYWQFP